MKARAKRKRDSRKAIGQFLVFIGIGTIVILFMVPDLALWETILYLVFTLLALLGHIAIIILPRWDRPLPKLTRICTTAEPTNPGLKWACKPLYHILYRLALNTILLWLMIFVFLTLEGARNPGAQIIGLGFLAYGHYWIWKDPLTQTTVTASPTTLHYVSESKKERITVTSESEPITYIINENKRFADIGLPLTVEGTLTKRTEKDGEITEEEIDSHEVELYNFTNVDRGELAKYLATGDATGTVGEVLGLQQQHPTL